MSENSCRTVQLRCLTVQNAGELGGSNIQAKLPDPAPLPQAHGFSIRRGETDTGARGVGDACTALLDGLRLVGARGCASGERGRVDS